MKILFDWLPPKRFFFVSLGVVGYFCLLLLNAYIIKSDFVLIGVFQELLTLPLLFIVQPGLLLFSIVNCVNEKFRLKSWSLATFLVLLISNLFFLGGFF